MLRLDIYLFLIFNHVWYILKSKELKPFIVFKYFYELF